MKKLALSPVLALAITGLAASPIIAAPEAGPDTVNRNVIQMGEQNGPPGAAAFDPKASLDKTEISQSDFADEDKGVVVTVTGLQAGDKVSDTLSKDPATTVESDTFTFNLYSEEKVDPKNYTFKVIVERDGEPEPKEIELSFDVVADDDEGPETPAVDPKASLDPTTITVSQLEGEGMKFTGEGFTPGGTVSLEGEALPPEQGAQGAPAQSAEAQAAGPIKVNEDGTIAGYLTTGEGKAVPGRYTVTFVDDETGEKTDALEYTVVEDETETPTTPAAEAKLTVSPEKITPADFVNEKKGVTLAVENCEPGSDVHFLVNPKGDTNVTAYDNTTKADDEGKASVTVYGTSASDPNAYIGDYDVTVTCGEDELTGAFSVAKDAAGGGDDGKDNGNGSGGGNAGGNLPRTGMELTGLVGGAALLLIGGVAVTMTKRRKKAGATPDAL